jgi:hypothetical protein
MSGVDAGPAWTAWTRVTPVVVGAGAREPYVRVPVPFSVAPGADGGYADLRVVASDGAEIPYALDPERAAAAEHRLPMIDAGFVPRRWTQSVLDLGTSGAVVDAVALDIDAARRPTYFVRVALDASDDRTTWRIVRDDAVVYRVAQDGGRGNATVSFPPTRSRWLRVRVLDPATPFPLTGARVAAAPPAEPGLARIPLTPVVHDDPAAHVRTWTFVGGVAIRPAAVAFADGGALYRRAVSVDASDDGASWTAVGDGTVAHYAEGGSQTTVALDETTARELRVTVHDGDDAPVPGLRPALLARQHIVVFPATGGGATLLSGDPAATAPSYDLGARLAHESWHAAGARTGETVANAGYRDARPVGERFPWLITGALIAVAVLLGGVALATVKRTTGEAPL